MANQTEKKQPKLYDLSELEAWLEKYEAWYNSRPVQTQSDTGSNPGTPPPPPPGQP